jgi:hypothetical protein
MNFLGKSVINYSKNPSVLLNVGVKLVKKKKKEFFFLKLNLKKNQNRERIFDQKKKERNNFLI